MKNPYFLKCVQKEEYKNKVSLRKAKEILKNLSSHFTVADEKMYRWKYDHNKTFAKANFNDPKTNKELQGYFKIFTSEQNSEPMIKHTNNS